MPLCVCVCVCVCEKHKKKERVLHASTIPARVPKSEMTERKRLTRSSSSQISLLCSSTDRCTSGSPSTTARAFWIRILTELVSVGRFFTSSGGCELESSRDTSGTACEAVVDPLFRPSGTLEDGCWFCARLGSAEAPVGFPGAPDVPAEESLGDSKRRRIPCNGGMISNVWGGGKGTIWGAVGASFKGVSGATEDFSSGVPTVGDREAIVGIVDQQDPEARYLKND